MKEQAFFIKRLVMKERLLKNLLATLIVGAIFISFGNSFCFGASTRIAILDSGFNDYFDKAISFTSLSPYYDPISHGSKISSLIKIYVPQADIYAIQVCEKIDGKYRPQTEAVLKAINWCVDHKIDLVNLSLTMEYNQEVADAIKYAYEKKGVIFVAAAGNKSWLNRFATKGGHVYTTKNNLSFPASCDSVISVGAMNKGRVAGYSVKGADFCTLDSFQDMKGTSVACAYATVEIAKIISKRPHIDINSIKTLLKK